jgi:hypothetical protein
MGRPVIGPPAAAPPAGAVYLPLSDLCLCHLKKWGHDSPSESGSDREACKGFNG